jgi:ATP-dependent RNA helicase DDX52/ROK1
MNIYHIINKTAPSKAIKSKIDLFDIEDSASEDGDEDEDVDAEDEALSSSATEQAPKKKAKLNSEDEINAFKNRLQIKTKGNDVPNPAATFNEMNIFSDLKSIIISNIEESRWKDPTPIQMQAIPVMLKGQSVTKSICSSASFLNTYYIFHAA